MSPPDHTGIVRAASALAASTALLTAVGCGISSPPMGGGDGVPGRPLDVRVVDAGAGSGITTPQERVVRDAAEWRRLWQAHQAGVVPERPLPAVDFSREMCVAIFAGQRPTGGFAVAVEQVVESASGIEVSYRVTGPPPGTIVAQVLTSPFQIIAVASGPGPVRFRRLPEG